MYCYRWPCLLLVPHHYSSFSLRVLILLTSLYFLRQRNCIEVTILPSSGEGDEDDTGANPPLRGVKNPKNPISIQLGATDPDKIDDKKSHCQAETNTCGPDVECENGGCCSQWGWCGSTAAHCGECCQSNCNAGVVADEIQDTMDSDDTDDTKSQCQAETNTCGPDVQCENGSCCSQWGWCGSTAAHCGECCQSNCWSS